MAPEGSCGFERSNSPFSQSLVRGQDRQQSASLHILGSERHQHLLRCTADWLTRHWSVRVERAGSAPHFAPQRSSCQTGAFRENYQRYLESVGGMQTSALAIDSAFKGLLRASELPSRHPLAGSRGASQESSRWRSGDANGPLRHHPIGASSRWPNGRLLRGVEFSSCTYTINIEAAWMETPPFPDRSSYGELVRQLSQQLL
jgi:hypothetical protein